MTKYPHPGALGCLGCMDMEDMESQNLDKIVSSKFGEFEGKHGEVHPHDSIPSTDRF